MKKSIIIIAGLFFNIITVSGQHQQIRLTDAWKLAGEKNKQLQISRMETKKVEEEIKEARSRLLPTVNATANYYMYAERPVIFLRDAASEKTVNAVQVGGRNALSAAITGSYPIIDPSIKSDIKLGQVQSQLTKEQTKELRNKVYLEVGILYYTIQFYKHQLQLLNQSLLRNERALNDSRQLFLQGKGLKADTLQSFIDVQNIKASIYNLQNKAETELQRLKLLIGLDDTTAIAISENLYEEPVTGVVYQKENLLGLALESRADIKVQELMSVYSTEAIQKAKSEFKPTLHAVAQYQLQSQSDKFSFWNYSVPRTSYAGLQLNIPIYSGKKERYKTAKIEYTLHQSALALADLKQHIQVELATLLQKLEDAYLQKQIQDKNIEAAQVNFSMIQERYRNGLSNRLEIADAEVMLTNAKLNQLQAVYQIKMFELQLQKAIGFPEKD